MKKGLKALVLGLIPTMSLLFFSCSDDGVSVDQYGISFPKESPTVVLNNYKTVNGNEVSYSIGFQNGNLRAHKIHLNWTGSNDSKFLCYKLNRYLGEGLQVSKTFNDKNISSYTDVDLVSNKSYFYEISTLLTDGSSKTDTITLRTSKFEAPSDFDYHVSSNGTKLTLFWHNNFDAASKYKVEKRNDSYEWDVLGSNVTDTTYQVSGLDSNATYHFRVMAISNYEQTAYGETLAQTNYNMHSASGLNTNVDEDSGLIELTWNDNSTGETGYRIYRKSSEGANYAKIADLGINAETYSEDFVALNQNADTLFYQVEVFNSDTAYTEEFSPIVLPEDDNNWGFEFGDLTGFATTGDALWTVTDKESSEGDYSVKSGTISDNQTSTLSFTRNFENDGIFISFYVKTKIEGYDSLKFYIDNKWIRSWTGNVSWSNYVDASTEGDAGNHTFKFVYVKDDNGNTNDDCVWIDDIKFDGGYK